MNWEQVKTIFWLRWRLMRNQLGRHGGIGIVFSILIGVAAGSLAVFSFIAGLLGAIFGLGTASLSTLWLTWLIFAVAFLFCWVLGLLAELQRSEIIDLQKLMHLPASLGQLFIINFLSSHFTLTIVIFVPAMVGIGIGLAFARSFEMILTIPLAAGLIFMISAWTYCFRGWLAQLMTNPRRRRTIIMCLTFSFIILVQGPNLYFNVFNGSHHHRSRNVNRSGWQIFDPLLPLQPYLPPLWLPLGERALAGGNPAPALLGTLGFFVIGALGLRRAYRSTMRFYHGETGGRAAVKIKMSAEKSTAGPKPEQRTGFLELNLPYVPEQAGALALATFRSLLRAPEVKLAWASSIFVPGILALMVVFRSASSFPDWVKPFAATASTAFPVIMLTQFLANQFGFDRDGFRALMLSSADRRLILLGKNLACLPIALGPGLFLLAFICVPLRLPLLTVFATLFQLISLFLIVGIAGNFVSILVPYRIAPGSIRPTKTKIEIVLLMMFMQMLFVTAIAPIFLPAFLEWFFRGAGLPEFIPVNLILSALLSGAMVLVYWQALGPLGRLLQKRETKILESVTAEVE
jgi:hypothetical protein